MFSRKSLRTSLFKVMIIEICNKRTLEAAGGELSWVVLFCDNARTHNFSGLKSILKKAKIQVFMNIPNCSQLNFVELVNALWKAPLKA